MTVGSLVTGLPTGPGPDDPVTGSDSDSTDTDGATTDTGDEPTGSSDSGTSTGDDPGLPPYCDDEIPAADREPLIDDLELEPGQMLPDASILMNDGRIGYWFTYNDDTPTGEQTPTPGGFQPAVGGANDSGYAAGTFGEGFTTWGAGMGVKVNNDFDGDCPYDVSSYDGLSFSARGNVTVRLSVTSRGTHPADKGGTCDPVRETCSDHHGVALELSETWETFVVPWSDLQQQGWGTAAEFDPTAILEIQWQAQENLVFEIYVDDLALWSDSGA